MEINIEFFESIKPVLIKLKKIIHGDFVVFGSAPLYLLGVVEFTGLETFNDLDIAIKDSGDVPKEAKLVTFQKNPEQKFYKLVIDKISVDIGTCWPGHEKTYSRMFIDPIIVDGFNFVNLRTIMDWKEEMVKNYNRQKDMEYLEKIRDYLKKKGMNIDN